MSASGRKTRATEYLVRPGFLDALVRAGVWASLSPSARAALVVLWFRSDSSGHCYMQDVRLAAESGISERSLLTVRAELRGKGIAESRVVPTPCTDGIVRNVMNYWLSLPPKDVLRKGRAALEARIQAERSRQQTKLRAWRERVKPQPTVP